MKKIFLMMFLFASTAVSVSAQKVDYTAVIEQAATTVAKEKGLSADKQAKVVEVLTNRRSDLNALRAKKLSKEEYQKELSVINEKYGKILNKEVSPNISGLVYKTYNVTAKAATTAVKGSTPSTTDKAKKAPKVAKAKK